MDKEIKNYVETIDILRKDIRKKEKEIHQAATFGQQLLNEKIELRDQVQKMLTQIEGLEQEKYSLQLNLESEKQTVITQTAELDIQTKTMDNLKEKVNHLEKQTSQLKQRSDNLEKEKNDLERDQQDLQLVNSSLRNNIKLLENQINCLQDNIGLSLNATGIMEETQDLSAYITKSIKLESTLAEVQQELTTTKLNENRLTGLVKELEEAVSDRDKELSSYSIAIQQEKDYSAELQCEIEVLKLNQLDPKRRGNSMFEELDDRRKLVEKEYKILSKKYENVLKNYEDNKKELTSCKGHMAILQSMTSKQHQDAYIKKLENQLSSSRREVDSLTFKLAKVVKSQAQQNPIPSPLSGDKYDYLRLMNQQAEKKSKVAENELMAALMEIKNLKDNLFDSHQRLYKVQNDLSDLKTENVKLKQEIKELMFTPDSEAPAKPKPRIEIMPGFESNPETLKLAEMALNENSQRRNDDFLPAESLLTKDGFVQIKPRRRTTKAILRDHLSKTSQENKTLKTVTEETENVPNVIKTEESASQVKPGNCPQQ